MTAQNADRMHPFRLTFHSVSELEDGEGAFLVIAVIVDWQRRWRGHLLGGVACVLVSRDLVENRVCLSRRQTVHCLAFHRLLRNPCVILVEIIKHYGRVVEL